MKRFLSMVALVAAALSVTNGCGTAQPTNTIEGVNKKAVLDYEAMVKADSAAMSASTQDDEKTVSNTPPE